MKTLLLNSLLSIVTLIIFDEKLSEKNIEHKADFALANQIIDSKIDSTESEALDLILSCGEYTYFNFYRSNYNNLKIEKSYFTIPYSGCLYNPVNNSINKLGWARIKLIAKQSYKKDFSKKHNYDKIDSIEMIINKMSPYELKEKFIPVIFLIEKKYLTYRENVEISYYPYLFPYVRKMFIFEESIKKWNLVDSVEIYHEIDDHKWVDSKFIEILNKK